jgi:pyruvate/2-oxoglutarate dehydrogenase complex dihydrolipoamide acyltransferase (E2) component
MRKLILIAAISLVSATANAGPSRSLSLASSEPTAAAEQPKTEQAAAPPAAVERPKLIAPQEQAKAPVAADKPEVTAKPKTRHVSTEARVIYELHRHGIYW